MPGQAADGHAVPSPEALVYRCAVGCSVNDSDRTHWLAADRRARLELKVKRGPREMSRRDVGGSDGRWNVGDACGVRARGILWAGPVRRNARAYLTERRLRWENG